MARRCMSVATSTLCRGGDSLRRGLPPESADVVEVLLIRGVRRVGRSQPRPKADGRGFDQGLYRGRTLSQGTVDTSFRAHDDRRWRRGAVERLAHFEPILSQQPNRPRRTQLLEILFLGAD